MTEEVYRKWDIWLKVVTPIVTIIGILLGVWQFNREQKNLDNLEYKRKSWEYQRNTYVEVATIVAKISTHAQHPKKYRTLTKRFQVLYWGRMIFVEDKKVREQMQLYRAELDDFERKISTISRLKARTRQLVKSLRDSSKQQWRSTVSEVEKEKTQD